MANEMTGKHQDILNTSYGDNRLAAANRAVVGEPVSGKHASSKPNPSDITQAAQYLNSISVPTLSTCETCGVTETTDDWHKSYGSCGKCVQDAHEDYLDSQAPYGDDQSDNQAADRVLAGTIDRSQLVATPQHGRFTGEFSYRVNHIDHPYHAGRTYSGYTEDEAIDAHKAHLEDGGN